MTLAGAVRRGDESGKAIIVLSGGLDSATALWWAKKQGWEASGLTFKYGRKNRREVATAKTVAAAAGVGRHIIVEAGFLKPVSAVPDADWRGRFPSVYVPMRNIVLFGVAAHYAEIYGMGSIVTGHTHIDPYPDSKPGFVKAVNSALAQGRWLSNGCGPRVIMPLAHLDKTGILKQAYELGVPVHLTWSCYYPGRHACGWCHGCKSRLEAFANLGLKDPVTYRRWETN
jgi:7-cyano-7-deazaguanine synthase